MLVSQWGLLDSLWSAVDRADGLCSLVSRGMAMAGQHSRLYLEVAAILDTDIPERADAIPKENL